MHLKNNIIYFIFCLHWVFLCCTPTSSSCSEQGYISLWYVSFSLQWLLLLWLMGLLLRGMWDLPGPGIELIFPALAGGLLTTEQLGKSYTCDLKDLKQKVAEMNAVGWKQKGRLGRCLQSLSERGYSMHDDWERRAENDDRQRWAGKEPESNSGCTKALGPLPEGQWESMGGLHTNI